MVSLRQIFSRQNPMSPIGDEIGNQHLSQRLSGDVQEYHASGRVISPDELRQNKFRPVVRVRYDDDGTVSYYAERSILLARGRVDKNGDAHGSWIFPQETKKDWVYAWFEKNNRIASASSPIKLMKKLWAMDDLAKERHGHSPSSECEPS